MELNEHGLRVWKHKTNKRLFLQQSYRWKDSLILLDETEGRQIIDSFKASTFNFNAWKPITAEEFSSVKSYFKEIYEIKDDRLDLSIGSYDVIENPDPLCFIDNEEEITCIFFGNNDLCKSVKCMNKDRADNKSIIFVKK